LGCLCNVSQSSTWQPLAAARCHWNDAASPAEHHDDDDDDDNERHIQNPTVLISFNRQNIRTLEDAEVFDVGWCLIHAP